MALLFLLNIVARELFSHCLPDLTNVFIELVNIFKRRLWEDRHSRRQTVNSSPFFTMCYWCGNCQPWIEHNLEISHLFSLQEHIEVLFLTAYKNISITFIYTTFILHWVWRNLEMIENALGRNRKIPRHFFYNFFHLY